MILYIATDQILLYKSIERYLLIAASPELTRIANTMNSKQLICTYIILYGISDIFVHLYHMSRIGKTHVR